MLLALLFGSPTVHGETVTHLYDNSGRLIKSYYNTGMAISWQYDPSGNIVRKDIAPSASPTTDIWIEAAGNSSWHSPANWQMQVPTRNLEVLIPPAATVLLSGADGEAGNLFIAVDSVLTVQSALVVYGTITVAGQLVDRGSVTARQ